MTAMTTVVMTPLVSMCAICLRVYERDEMREMVNTNSVSAVVPFTILIVLIEDLKG